MNGILKKLERLSDEQLYQVAEAIDGELERRAERELVRGYRRSTYMADRVRGRRKAPRSDRMAA